MKQRKEAQNQNSEPGNRLTLTPDVHFPSRLPLRTRDPQPPAPCPTAPAPSALPPLRPAPCCPCAQRPSRHSGTLRLPAPLATSPTRCGLRRCPAPALNGRAAPARLRGQRRPPVTEARLPLRYSVINYVAHHVAYQFHMLLINFTCCDVVH
jgi:hypothetical protein